MTLSTEKKQLTLQSQLQLPKMREQIDLALPKGIIDTDRFIRVALSELNANPTLAQCEKSSFFYCLMTCAQLGLEPGKSLGHAYLIPYKDNQNNRTVSTFILGYRGMIALARRSKEIISISAREVCKNDKFHVQYGLEEKLIHEPAVDVERGPMIAVYAVARLVGGGYQFDVMSKDEVEEIRKRSKSGNKGPWVTDFEEMAKKTIIRRLFKYLPVSLEAQRASAMDEAADRGEQREYIDMEPDIKLDPELLGNEEPPIQIASDVLAGKI